MDNEPDLVMEMNDSGESMGHSTDKRMLFQVHDLRFEVIFRKIKNLFDNNAIPHILLKGPHLAYAVYDHPHERVYDDLDILVKPDDFNKAARILMETGLSLLDADRNLATLTQTNHWAFRSRFGQIIELHRGFSGLGRHPVDLDAWFARAEEFLYGQTKALGLATEDLLCQLCLHIGKSFFYLIDKKHILDIDVLIRKREIKWIGFVQLCLETRSRAIAYYCLSATQTQHGTSIPTEVLAALRPKKIRRIWLDKHLDVSAFPIYRFQVRGLGHARRRLALPLLDGIRFWIPFMIKAVAVKGMDAGLRVPLLGRLWKKKFEVRDRNSNKGFVCSQHDKF